MDRRHYVRVGSDRGSFETAVERLAGADIKADGGSRRRKSWVKERATSSAVDGVDGEYVDRYGMWV